MKQEHKRYCVAGPLQSYRNRDYVANELDQRIFDEMNKGIDGYVTLMTMGCLDALEQLPAGSMRAHDEGQTENPQYYGPSVVIRGMSAAEVQADIDLTLELLRELDAEESADIACQEMSL